MNDKIATNAMECALQDWSIGIGDPHAIGWVTVIVYAIASLTCFTLVARGDFADTSSWRERVFWGGTGLILAFLAINKQLDLQSLMTAIGRYMALQHGWYEDRHAVQRRFILGLMAGTVILAVVIAWFLRGTLRDNGIAVTGFVLVLGFVVIRAIGFHDMDRLIGTRVLSMRMNWILELGGLGLSLFAGVRRLRRC